jgi:alpha-mannosidase
VDDADIRRGRGRYPEYTRARLRAFAPRLMAAVWPERAPVARIEMAGPIEDRIAFKEARKLDYRPVEVGEPLGPLWATYWFKITARAPAEWAGEPVDLYWDSRSEGLLWLDGRSAQGLNIGRHEARLTAKAGNETLSFFVEVACNRAFGDAENPGRPHTRAEPYRLAACELRRFDAEAWGLSHDFEVLRLLEADREPPQTPRSFGGVAPRIVRPALERTWAGRLLHDLNRVCNLLDPEDRSTWAAARAILKPLLGARNGSVAHELSAIGHAHIDTAWLWPIEETTRKCQRTFATAIRLMDAYPDFKFACSQAYQYAVIEETDPDLFARIKQKAQAGQWIPVGGSWVEPDCNLPSGESICRQFLYGQAYFQKTFGARSTIFWNPDVFGYAGQLPQLMREAGMDRFLTQKLSWNRFTAPPHHSFYWRGLDGSEVLTHFPPADTYNGMATPEEVRYHAANYKDADRTEDGLYLFGFGDGGGGPNARMIENLARMADLEGAPRIAMREPAEFFDRLERAAGDLATIEGELYFEYHRGTYTSQAEIKRLNRRCEGALLTLDYLCAAARLAEVPHPDRKEVEGFWRTLLTNQFHDILPGSSIGEVYARTGPELQALEQLVQRECDDILRRLCKPDIAPPRPLNALDHPLAEVVTGPDGSPCYVVAPAHAAGRLYETEETVTAEAVEGGGVKLDNGRITAVLSQSGALTSLMHHATHREALSGEGNRIVLYDDRPTEYEAWDIDPFALETAREAEGAHSCEVTAWGPLRAEARFERRLGRASTLVQTVRLDAASDRLEFHTVIDWRERRTLVKAVFPLAPRAANATYETMFGAVERPTHANTDADLARYEVPGHRWADLSEPGFGVSLLSDARYGFSTWGRHMALSLVRGPVAPDAGADLGEHRFAYALYPHAGDWRAGGTVAEAARFNRPPLWVPGEPAPVLRHALALAEPAQVIIDTIKPAEDGAGWVIRLYESSGAPARALITFAVPITQAFLSNTLEDKLEPVSIEEGFIGLDLRGFQIATLRVA